MGKNIARWLAVFLLAATTGLALAQPVTYTATSTGGYTFQSDYTGCNFSGSCQNFSFLMGGSGSFTTSTRLGSNLVNASITPLVSAFTFTNGIDTFSGIDPEVYVKNFLVSTDASGAITSTSISVFKWISGSSPHVVGDALAQLSINSGTSNANHNMQCLTVAGDGSCLSTFSSQADGTSTAAGATVAWSSPPPLAPSAAAPIPTLSQWGVILTGACLALAGWAVMRRKDS